MRFLIHIALASSLAGTLAACGPEETGPTTDAEIIEAEGTEANLEVFDIERAGHRLVVRVLDRGAGRRLIGVASRGNRGLEKSDAQLAYDAAFEAAAKMDCGGGAPMKVDAATAKFQQQGEASIFFERGGWSFQGQCG